MVRVGVRVLHSVICVYSCSLAHCTYLFSDRISAALTFYIIRKGELDKRRKSFCFSEWYGIHVCIPQSHYELSIMWRWQISGWEILLKNFLSACVRRCLSDSSLRYPRAVIYGRVRG